MSPQVRADSVSPRRTASGPSVVPTNFAIEPSGPNTCAISPAPASTFAPAANGYLFASEFWNGWYTCAFHTLFTSTLAGWITTANACISGRTRSGRSDLRCESVKPVSICSSTNFSESASSEPLPSSVCCIS